MDRNFSRSLDAVLAYEGGYSNHPEDNGGPTNLGITLANFRRFVMPNGTIEDLKKLTREQAAVVYRRQYWDAVMGAELPDGDDHVIFDYAVNSGPGRAEKLAQKIVGATVDGQIGPQTLEKIRQMAPVEFINRYCDARLTFLQGLNDWGTFGNGWSIRLKKVRALAHELAQQAPDAPRVEIKHIEKVVEVEKPVAVVPEPPHRKINLPAGALAIAAPAVSAFVSWDLPSKLIFGAIGIAAVVILVWQGELVIRRIRKVIDEFGDAG